MYLFPSNQIAEAYNFGRPGVDNHQIRYGRAKEFVDVCIGLWDSWDDDAFIRDTQASLYFEPDSMHYLNHKGTTYNVRGPLNVPRPPQGYPVIVQAGASDEGRELAAQHAEAIFCPHLTVEAAKAYYTAAE